MEGVRVVGRTDGRTDGRTARFPWWIRRASLAGPDGEQSALTLRLARTPLTHMALPRFGAAFCKLTWMCEIIVVIVARMQSQESCLQTTEFCNAAECISISICLGRINGKEETKKCNAVIEI